MNTPVTIIGAGLAGSEAALTLSRNGLKVELYEMKPAERSLAHSLDSFCELVCNNSLCSIHQKTPQNLLFKELTLLDSSLVPIIQSSLVHDEKNIAVDKRAFSAAVTKAIKSSPNIDVFEETVREIPLQRPLIIATGPLTSGNLLAELANMFGGMISIQDASCAVIDMGSVDIAQVNRVSDDLIEIYLNKNEYKELEEALSKSSVLKQSSIDEGLNYLQCMPIEMIAQRKHGLLKETRLFTETEAYAQITLRKDDRLMNSAVISGFMTRMTHAAQDKVIHSIRGLEKAKIVRYGRMHINSFIDSPNFLLDNYEVASNPSIYIIGQLSGVDGYLAAASSALVACSSIVRQSQGLPFISFPQNTITGGLAHYVTTPSDSKFYPMTASYSLFSKDFYSDDEAYIFSSRIFEEWRNA